MEVINSDGGRLCGSMRYRITGMPPLEQRLFLSKLSA